MAIVVSMPIGTEICEILKVNPKRFKTISFTAGDVIKVDVIEYLLDAEIQEFKKVIKKYKLVER